MAHDRLIPDVGDWVQVKLHRQKPGAVTRTVSVVTGVVIKHHSHGHGFPQYQLDNGWWFCPQIDTVLEHRPGNSPSSYREQDTERSEIHPKVWL